MYIKILQENSLCSCLYHKQAKTSFFFSSTKSEKRRAEQVLPREGDWYQWEGRVGGKRG
jgi:ribosomal protein L24E